MFPYYLAMGMTYAEYWDGDPYLVVFYRKAHKHRLEMRNQEMWLQGVYIFNAVSVAISNMHLGKGKPPNKYMDKPLEIFPPTAEEQERRAQAKRQEIVARLNAIKANFDAAKKRQGEQHNGNHD